MAPDINTLANWAGTDGYATNQAPRDDKYEIPDVVIHGPTARKIKVLSIGAGVSGIMNAYHIQKLTENVEHVIYEKNPGELQIAFGVISRASDTALPSAISSLRCR